MKFAQFETFISFRMFKKKKQSKENPENSKAVPKTLKNFKHSSGKDTVDGMQRQLSKSYEESEIRTCSLRSKESRNDVPDSKTSEGYGFNLATMKSHEGHFVDSVRPSSEAELSGLRKGDLIVSINEIEISRLTHPEVVGMIKKCYEQHADMILQVRGAATIDD